MIVTNIFYIPNKGAEAIECDSIKLLANLGMENDYHAVGGDKQLTWEDKDLRRSNEVFSELYFICEYRTCQREWSEDATVVYHLKQTNLVLLVWSHILILFYWGKKFRVIFPF